MNKIYLGTQEVANTGSGGGGGSSVTKLSQMENDCDFRSIFYLTKEEYEDASDAGTLDSSAMYVIVDLAEESDFTQFVTTNDVSQYVTQNDISTFIVLNDVSIYAKESDMNGYISRADAGQIVESHYSQYISSYNTLYGKYSDVSNLIGDVDEILDQIIAGN